MFDALNAKNLPSLPNGLADFLIKYLPKECL